MTAEDATGGDDRGRDRSRGDTDGRFGLRIGAGIRAFRGLFGGSPDRSSSRTSPGDRSGRRRRFVPRGSGSRDANGRTRTKRIRVSGPDDCLTQIRREDGAFVVTADVLGTDPAALSVCIDHGGNDLLIREDGRVLERVDLPWRSVDASAGQLNNGVLEVRLRPGSE